MHLCVLAQQSKTSLLFSRTLFWKNPGASLTLQSRSFPYRIHLKKIITVSGNLLAKKLSFEEPELPLSFTCMVIVFVCCSGYHNSSFVNMLLLLIYLIHSFSRNRVTYSVHPKSIKKNVWKHLWETDVILFTTTRGRYWESLHQCWTLELQSGFNKCGSNWIVLKLQSYDFQLVGCEFKRKKNRRREMLSGAKSKVSRRMTALNPPVCGCFCTRRDGRSLEEAPLLWTE